MYKYAAYSQIFVQVARRAIRPNDSQQPTTTSYRFVYGLKGAEACQLPEYAYGFFLFFLLRPVDQQVAVKEKKKDIWRSGSLVTIIR